MTRSEGSSHLAEYQSDIGKFERANRRKKQAQARIVEMAEDGHQHQFQELPQIPPAGNAAAVQAAAAAAAQAEAARLAAQNQRPVPVRQILRDHDTPNAEHYRDRFQYPPIPRNDFEIKTGLVSLVKQNQFHGLASENPVYHLDNFEDVCSTLKMNGVPDDAVKCRLFIFSLADKAHHWFRSLNFDNLRSWEDYKAVFLTQYFTQSRTALLSNKLTTFQQGGTESFHDAWERFKDYRECPHHGFPHATLINTFYRGCDKVYRMALDTGSGGNFMTKSDTEAELLIENLAGSNSSQDIDYNRSQRGGGAESKQIAELTAKVEQLLKRDQRMVNYCDDSGKAQAYQEFIGDGSEDFQAELNYVNNFQGNYQNKGFNQNYRSHPNLSYRSTNVENPQDQVYPAQMGSQGQQFQPKTFPSGNGNFSNKVFVPKPHVAGQSGFQQKPQFSNFKGGYQAPGNTSLGDNEMKQMMQQILEGQKKNAADINVKVDSMYNDLHGKFESLASHVKTLENQVTQTASASARPMGVLPGKPVANPKDYNGSKEYVQAISLRSGKQLNPILEKEKAIAISDDSGKDIAGEKSVAKPLVEEVEAEEEVLEKGETEEAATSPYVPKLPFLGRLRKIQREKEYARFDEIMNELQVKLPFLELVMNVPTYRKHLKDILTNKKTLEEGAVLISHECSAILQNIVPKKMEDPGSFVLPGTIGEHTFNRCLCDLGAGVSLMPFSVSKRLGLTNFTPTKMSLILADRSVRFPVGVAEDVHVRVGNFYITTDFVIIELDEEPRDPLILGRPFLNTAGALIDVRKSKIKLHIGDFFQEFNMERVMSKPR
ncbi:uncharacterized protein LOC111829410 [Capsella rubella]|uniref:uncharacterized protein LOC111829410 n=1 Tax=Capsella rubella TaxID=81985 RepID=UPI000CD54084|nr:uncharacterized protein LOC111829410 [Capsella rubella]